MEVIEYFASENQDHWKAQIAKSDWRAAKYLVKLLNHMPQLNEELGADKKLYLLVEGQELLSFATLTHQDCIDDLSSFPWIGFLFTFPQHRGNRYSQKLVKAIELQAKTDGHNTIHIATDHVGLYEKYGYVYSKTCLDKENQETRVYTKILE